MQTQEQTNLKITESAGEQVVDSSSINQPSAEQAAEGIKESEGRGPVAQAMRYRKRAQQAEQELAMVKSKLDEMQSQLSASKQTIDQLERRQRIEAELAEEEALDVEAARLLTEVAVQQMREPDVKLAVADLKRHKPWLFGQKRGATAGAMPARKMSAQVPEALVAAEKAASTGDRRDLLRYLKLRRKK